MDLSIIIPTYNRGNIFNKTIQHAIEAVKHRCAEIIVVNDINGNDLVIPLENPVATQLVKCTRPGVAAKRNLGASIAKGDLLLFLDDDILISRSSIEQMLIHHNTIDDLCLNPDWNYPGELQQNLAKSSFGRFLIKNNMVSFKGWYKDDSWQDDALFPSNSVASFHLSLTRRNFMRSGGYNENFVEAGFEDYDFPKKLKKIGLNFFIDTRIKVYHNEEDRNALEPWLKRQERGAFTRREAVRLGYQELAIRYSAMKTKVLTSILILKPLFLKIFRLIPNSVVFDAIAFRIILLLLAVSIHKGYTQRKL